eukprot:scaffold1189_cov194-Amphora_coffeaeformis.AAC.16
MEATPWQGFEDDLNSSFFLRALSSLSTMRENQQQEEGLESLDSTQIPFPLTQIYILEYVSYLTAPLSVMGSGLIIYVLLYNDKARRRLKEKDYVYYRIMLGMSMLDILASGGVIIFGPWTVPRQHQFNIVNNYGNSTTCAVSGFFLNMVFGPMLYSAVLALYFLCRIRYELRDEWIAKYVEPYGHALAWAHPLVLGTLGVAYKAFVPLNSLPGWCWFDEQCQDNDCEGEDQRRRGVVAAYQLGGLPMIIPVWTVILVCMVLIFCKVRRVEERIQRYAGSSSMASSSSNSRRSRNENRRFKRTRETANEGLLYIGAFFLTFVPMAGTQSTSNSVALFVFAFLCKTLTTMQGFFNAFIFFRKRYEAMSEKGEPLHFIHRLKTKFAQRACSCSCRCGRQRLPGRLQSDEEAANLGQGGYMPHENRSTEWTHPLNDEGTGDLDQFPTLDKEVCSTTNIKKSPQSSASDKQVCSTNSKESQPALDNEVCTTIAEEAQQFPTLDKEVCSNKEIPSLP